MVRQRWYHTEETKVKMSKTHIGMHHSEETIKKMHKKHKMIAPSNKNRTSWNKGIPLTEETKKKMSEKLKGHVAWNKGIPRDEEIKKKISEKLKGRIAWNKGIPHTEETKKKMSEKLKGNTYMKGKHHTQETKNILAKKMMGNTNGFKKGQKLSIEARQKLSKMFSGSKNPMYGKHFSKEQKKRISESEKGKIISIEHRKKISKFNKGKILSIKTKKKMSISRCKYLSEKSGTFSNTLPERILKAQLLSNMILFSSQKHIKGQSKNFVVDFFIAPNIVIEVDGDYYHCNPRIYPDGPKYNIQKNHIITDAIKDKELFEKGYIVLRFWEYDIKNNLHSCANKIQQTIR